MRAFVISIYNNAETNKARVEDICEKHGVKIGPLFEAIVEGFTDEDWAKYAALANEKKGIGKTTRAKVAKQLRDLDDYKLQKVLQALQEQGVDLD